LNLRTRSSGLLPLPSEVQGERVIHYYFLITILIIPQLLSVFMQIDQRRHPYHCPHLRMALLTAMWLKNDIKGYGMFSSYVTERLSMNYQNPGMAKLKRKRDDHSSLDLRFTLIQTHLKRLSRFQ
jgi:hypothetical protein